MRLIDLLRRNAASSSSDLFAGYTLLSSLLPSMTTGQSLALGSGSKLLVDVQMQDSDRIGQITPAAGSFIRFDPTKDTRLLCAGLDIYGDVRSEATHPKAAIIDLCGAIPTTSGNSGGGALIRGKTHNGDTPTGNNGTTNDNGGLSRGIIVNPGGILRLTGQAGPQARRLNAHYASGTTLTLDAPVTAKAGAKVIVSPTGFFNSGARTEVRTLAADVNNSATITINTALGYARWGLLQYATDSGISTSPGTFSTMRAHANQNRVIDQRAFVCIMDRNIKIRGYDAGNTSLASYGFGMHGMSMGLTSETVLTNVEFDNYGQLGLLGRYGWHFHLPSWNPATGAARTDGAGGTNVYPTDKALVDSCTFVAGFNRAFTFHGCKGVKATNCIAHDSAGHSFFFEDGSEENNESSYNVALAPRDPGSSYRLKAHDDTPSGHWFANLNNTLLENWGVDCPGHGWWNAPSRGLAARASNQYGCLGSSSLVAIAPFYGKLGTWTGNSAMSCNSSGGITDSFPVDNEGNLGSAKIQSTSDGLAGADYGNPNQIETLLTGARLFKNNGGYTNRISNPHYDLWVCADNKGAHFSGATDDGVCSKPIVVRESLNHESNVLSTGFQNAFASYHDLLDFKDVSAFGFSGGTPTPGNYNLLQKNAVMESWDLYTDPIQGLAIDDTNWKLYNSLGMYQTAPPCLMNDTTTWNTYYGGQFYEDNPYNPGVAPSGGSNKFRWAIGVTYDRWGHLTTGPSTAGVAQSYIVFNHPFHTTGISSTAMPEHGGTSVYTSTPFFGINPQYDETYALDPYQNFKAACTFYRVDSSRADIAGASWGMRDSSGSNSTFFNNMKHAAVPKDAMVRFRHTAQGSTPNSTKFGAYIERVAQADNPASSTADAFILGVDWSGSVVPNVTFDGQTFTQVAGNTWAALMSASSGYNYWRDTAANMLWIKVRFASNVTGGNNNSVMGRTLAVTN